MQSPKVHTTSPLTTLSPHPSFPPPFSPSSVQTPSNTSQCHLCRSSSSNYKILPPCPSLLVGDSLSVKQEKGQT